MTGPTISEEHWRENLWPENSETTDDHSENEYGVTVTKEASVTGLLLLLLLLNTISISATAPPTLTSLLLLFLWYSCSVYLILSQSGLKLVLI